MYLLLRALLISAVACASLAAQERIDSPMIAQIRDEGLTRSKVLETFNHLVNVIGPRLTGTPAHKQSAEYAKAKLTEWGASNPHLEAWKFGRGWTLEKLTLEMTAPRYYPLVGYPEAWTPSTKGVITGTPIYLGDATAAQITAMGDKLRGAIILATQPQTNFITADRLQPADNEQAVRIGAPPMIQPRGVIAGNAMAPILKQHGAAVMLKPNMGEHGTMFVLGSMNTANDAVPSIVVSAEHYNQVVRLVQSGTPVQMQVEVQSKYHEADSNSYNLIAEIPGEDPVLKNEVILLGAHIDSWHSSSGATDNADGAASMMEAMRILKAVGAHPRRTIRLALWSGEEEGLLGSKAYVNQHLKGSDSVAARQKIALYINDDPGSGPTYGFYMENNADAKSIFDAWTEPLKDLSMKRNVITPIGNTDHLSFLAVGIPGFTAIKDYVEYDVRTHHTNVDAYERVKEADLKQSAIVMAVFAYQAANRDGVFPRPVRP